MKILLAGFASVLLLTMTMATSVDAANVPDWVKNNAGWWAQDQIDDAAFVSGVQYMIEPVSYTHLTLPTNREV